LGVAENSMVKLFGIDAGAPDGLLTGDGGQLHGGKIAQFAAIAAHGRARATYDCDVCCLCAHWELLVRRDSDRSCKLSILSARLRPRQCMRVRFARSQRISAKKLPAACRFSKGQASCL